MKSQPHLCTKEVENKFKQMGRFSRKALLEIDRQSLLMTFEQAIDDVRIYFKGQSQNAVDQQLFMQIYHDLKKEPIEKVYRKWEKYF